MQVFIDESGSPSGSLYVVAGLCLLCPKLLEDVIRQWRNRFYRTRKQRKSAPPNEYKDSRATLPERHFVLERVSHLPVLVSVVACSHYSQHRDLPRAVVAITAALWYETAQPLRVVIDDPGLSKKRRRSYDEAISGGLAEIPFAHTWVCSEASKALQATDAIAGAVRRYVENASNPEYVTSFNYVQSRLVRPIIWLGNARRITEQMDPVRLTLTVPSLSTELQPAIASITRGFASRSGLDRVPRVALPLRPDYMTHGILRQEGKRNGISRIVRRYGYSCLSVRAETGHTRPENYGTESVGCFC